MWFQIILLSFSLSVDALGMGVSYGFQGVKIDRKAKLAVGLVSMVIMGIAVTVGGKLTEFLPEKVVSRAGAALLMVMGFWFLYQNLLKKQETNFDRDNSRCIDMKEGIILGAALSADSISAGIAAVATGMSGVLLAPVVGLMQIFLLHTGDWLVRKNPVMRRFDRRVCGTVSGILLIVIGIARIL